MKSAAKTIQIFLPTGEPTGIRMAEITTRIVRVIEIPRALLQDFFAMEECTGGAVYFLFGSTVEEAKPKLYIGQTGDLKARLSKHNQEKDFWQRAVVVLSRAESLTTTHSLYLERLCIQRAKQAARYTVENDTNGNKLNTTKPIEAECEELFETAEVLMSTLGFPAFSTPGQGGNTPEEDTFYCAAADYDAKAQYTSEGMYVIKGSKAKVAMTDYFKEQSVAKTRQTLIDAGILKENGEHYVFTQNYLFGSPSAAASVVVGRNMNGWTSWKTKEGKALSELKR